MTMASVTRFGDLLDFGNFLKPLAAINLSKSHTFLGNFCKGVKIYHSSSFEPLFVKPFCYLGTFLMLQNGQILKKSFKHLVTLLLSLVVALFLLENL